MRHRLVGHVLDRGGLCLHRHLDRDIRRRNLDRRPLHLRRRRRRRLVLFLDLLDHVGLDRRSDQLERASGQAGGQRPRDEHVQRDDREKDYGSAGEKVRILYVGSHELI